MNLNRGFEEEAVPPFFIDYDENLIQTSENSNQQSSQIIVNNSDDINVRNNDDDEYLNERIISEHEEFIKKEVMMVIEKKEKIEEMMRKEFLEQLLDGKFVKALKMTLFKDFQKPYIGVKMSEKRFKWFGSVGSTIYQCFLVGDLIDWICKYWNISEKESFILLRMMNVLGWIGASQKSSLLENCEISKSELFKVLIKPKLVVIGGGMSGYKVCQSTILNNIFDLTVIDREGTLDLVPIYPTLITDKNNINHISIDHKKTLPETVTCIKGHVTKVTKFGLFFETLDTVSVNEDVQQMRKNSYFMRYDYLIIGAGCTCWSEWLPIRDDNRIKFVNSYSADSLVESHNFIEEARENDEICVVGGGFVGVEIAGFLAEKYKEKNITIIQRSDILMRPSTESHNAVMEIYKTMGNVKVMLKSQIVAQKDPYTFTVKTTMNEEKDMYTDIGCSVCFICTGMKPQTEILKSHFDSCLDDKGFIQVNESMQVMMDGDKPFSNIFAIGDITNVKETKLATCAHKHAKTACAVLPQIIQSTPPISLATYKPRGYQQLQGVIVGPNNGLWIKGTKVLLNSKLIALAKERGQAAKGRRMNKR